MSLELIDHNIKALERLTFDLTKPDFEKFTEVYTRDFQQIEEALFEMAGLKNIDNAFGVWLDYIGKIIGIPRNGLSDELYRAALKLKVGINSADGTPNVMIDLITQYTGATSTRLVEGTIAFGTIYNNGSSGIDSTLYQLVQDIKPAGTRWVIHSDFYDNAFQPNWEISVNEREVFRTTADGISLENFQTTFNLVEYEDFYISTSKPSIYEPSTGRDVPDWEALEEQVLSVNTGVIVDTLSVNTGVIVDELEVVNDISTGLPSLCWEVGEDSKIII